jgi:hypothetical protein
MCFSKDLLTAMPIRLKVQSIITINVLIEQQKLLLGSDKRMDARAALDVYRSRAA